MFKVSLRLIAAIALGITISRVVPARASRPPEDPPTFAQQLEDIRDKHHVPGMAAAAMRGGKMVQLAVAGVRRAGSTEKVALDDCWHIGSCTKSMTASVIAMMVERGIIDWHSRVEDVFPEARTTMDPAWHAVTLDQLLTHRSGAASKTPEDVWAEVKAWANLDPAEQRRSFCHLLMQKPPRFAPGRFRYSDEGYAIAGTMLERRTHRTWEELMRSELFTPLGMKTADFGAPGSPDKVDQPWGHSGTVEDPKPIRPGPDADNPPAIGPAATVHCSISDFARYAAWHARAGQGGEPDLLTCESFSMLHAPTREDYALGWSVLNRDWGGGHILMHSGSNSFWYAVMWVAPQRDAAFVATANIDEPESQQACHEAIMQMVENVLGNAQ